MSDEARHSGWKPLDWSASIAQFALGSGNQALLESLMNAIHYRWDPLVLQEIHAKGVFGVRDKRQLLSAGMQLRLAKDFPRLWSRQPDCAELVAAELKMSRPDWSAVLWGGDELGLREWLLRGPIDPHLCALAWKPEISARAAQVVSVLTTESVALERRVRIAQVVPASLLLLAVQNAKLLVKGLVMANCFDKLAKLIQESSKCKKVEDGG